MTTELTQEAISADLSTPVLNIDWKELSSTPESLKTIAARPKKKHTPKPNNAVDVSPLLDKYNKTNMKPQTAALLIPSNRQAVSYLSEAFANKGTITVGEDGIDHINVSAMGKTNLGKFLDINARAPFNHPELSHFQSVGGLWFYVKSEDHLEEFRYIWGNQCRKQGKQIKTIEVKGFKTIIADATWIKIISNQDIINEMIESELPFKNYFYYGALHIKKTTPEAAWYTQVLEEIRKCLKLRVEINDNTRQPDFSFIETMFNR